jgi:short-subunit dehydrogenase involved in D-alanine esterification of teichoic acids
MQLPGSTFLITGGASGLGAAALARHIVENEMLNGVVIRLDGAIRMGPR